MVRYTQHIVSSRHPERNSFLFIFACFLFGFISAPLAHSQATKTVLAQPANPAKSFKGVFIKWIPAPFETPAQVNIYRQEAGGAWVKLNEQPYTNHVYQIPEAKMKSDSSANAVKIAGDKIQSGEEKGGFLLAMALVTAVMDHDFGMYFGIEYLDATAQPGKKYKYEVRELKAGTEISWGVSAEVEGGKFIPAAAPKNVLFKEGDASIEFSWDKEPNRFLGMNAYRALKGYPLQKINPTPIIPSRGNAGGSKPEWIWQDEGLEGGKTYVYEFRGIDFFGEESAPTNTIEITALDLNPPAAPDHLTAEAKGDQVTLKWKYKGDKECAGYQIYRTLPNTDTNWVKITKSLIDVRTLTYIDKVQQTDRDYGYYVAAVDAAGNEAPADEARLHVYDTIPPAIPAGLVAKADTGIIKLSWVANGEPDLAGYKIYRAIAGSTEEQFACLISKPYGLITYTDTLTRKARNKFVYRITAIDSAFNESKRSAIAEARMPDADAPGEPFIKDILAEGATITLTWMLNPEEDVVGYYVFRSVETPGDSGKWVQLTPQPLAKTQDHFTDKNPPAGVKCNYRIQAVDLSKNVSGFSGIVQSMVKDTKMAIAAQNLSGKFDEKKNQVILQWEIETPPDFLGCMVYRKEGDSDFLPVSGLLKENKYESPVSGKGKKYFYEIRSFDAAGNFSRSAQVVIEIPIEIHK